MKCPDANGERLGLTLGLAWFGVRYLAPVVQIQIAIALGLALGLARFGSVWLGLCNLVVQWARKPPTVWLPSGLGGMRESPTIGSAGRITGQTVPGSTVQRQPLQQCAKISSENRALFFEMPPSFKILKCNWMWPGRAGLVHPSFLIIL